MEPLVSVVIPTKSRPKLLLRAIRSVLEQTYSNFEVVVVIDGLDALTSSALAMLDEKSVRSVQNRTNQGGAQSRNIGVKNSRGEWIAFLDDDDEWLPTKLERQMQQLTRSTAGFPVGACRLIARKSGSDAIWPHRRPREGEPMSEYLLCRKSLSYGEGVIQTSVIVAKRSMLTALPFRGDLRRHHDWDWVLRATALTGLEIVWVWEPLVIFNLEAGRPSVNRETDWTEALQWAADNPLITAKAFSYFVAVQVAPRLNLIRDYRRLPRLVFDIARRGRLEWRALLFGLLFAAIPTSLLKRVSQSGMLARRANAELRTMAESSKRA